MNTILLAAAVVVSAPDGAKVCEVTPPSYDGARLETRPMAGGVAWRFIFEGSGERTIAAEEWTFDFGADLRCWPVSHAQGEYLPKTLSTIATMAPMPSWAPVAAGIGKMFNYETNIVGSAESPLVVEGGTWTAVVGDAGVLDYARIRFMSGDRPGTLKTVLEGSATVKLPYATPWRYVHVEKDPCALAGAQPAFLDRLNAECRIADTGWIRPGKVMRLAKLDTAVGREAVDFIVANNLQYLEIDCGWYGNEHTDDPLKPGLAPERVARGERFDLHAIIDYANSKDVGVILYVNREPLKRNGDAGRDRILDALVSWGVKGVKYGFVNVGDQRWRKWTVDAIQAAADRKLLVDIHDEFRLTGIQKTFPNVLTVEGIRGNEEMPTAAHDCALPFTRFLDGPGDYTPCWSVKRVQNTLAHQLALPCVYTSGLQFLFWYSKPSDVKPDPALDFWREIPAEFDETRFLQGRIGEFAVVARRKGTKWFVGGINAQEKRTFGVPLEFAGADRLRVRLFKDADPDVVEHIAPVACEEFESGKGGTLKVTAASNGGFAAIVEPL